MKTKLSLDQSNRVEVEFIKPSLTIKTLDKIDTLVNSLKAPSLVATEDFVKDLNMIKLQRGSRYNIIAIVDPDFATFGISKIYKLSDLSEADGFDICITNGRNKAETVNEVDAIVKFIKQFSPNSLLRWTIDTKEGPEHINNCLDAIKRADRIKNNDLISLKTDHLEVETAHKLVAKCRESFGKAKSKFKISGKPEEGFIVDDANLLYQINAEELM